MVYFHTLTSVCKLVHQPGNMVFSVRSSDLYSKSRQNNQACKSRKTPNSQNYLNIPDCHRSRSAAVDVLILVVVMGACGFLLFPYIKLFYLQSVELVGTIFYLMREELSRAPLIYACTAISILCTVIAAWGILACMSNKCGKPNCQGLRKAAEFDIQLETEDCVKNSSALVKDGVKRGLFELPRNHHRELEAELKKMAPPNGRAVLVFRARCGCSVGRLEVPGPTKKQRKIKK